MNVFLTGATGFIGSHVARKLVEHGHSVIGTGVSTEWPASCTRLLTPSLIGINWAAIKDIDVVLHLAANNDTRCQDEEEMMLANYHAPIMLFNHCLNLGCQKFVYASSASVYGHMPSPQSEDATPEPLNPYAHSKLKFESFARSFAEQNSVAVTGLRYFNVYGPGEQHKGSRASMVSQMIWAVKARRPITLFKDGNQKRDWVYVSDVADMTIAAANLTGHNTLNVGTGQPRSFNEIVKILRDLGHNVDVSYIDCPFEASFQADTCAETKKAESLLGSRLFVTLEEGISRLAAEPSR